MSKYLSRKIKFISLFSMIAVVYIHSYNYKDNFLVPTTLISEGVNWGAGVEYFFSNALLRFSVPLFFIISGYLFFRNFESIKKSYITKLKSRLFSLVIPYCLWAFISAVLMLLLSYLDIFKSLDIINERVLTGNYILLSCFIDPPAFQLWYLQQLIIFTLLSPLFYLAIKHTKGFILIPFGLLWLLDLNFVINSQALFFFSIGAYIGIYGKERYFVKKDNPVFTTAVTVCWIALSAIITILAMLHLDIMGMKILRLFLYKCNEVCGVVAMWVLFDHLFKRMINKKIMVLASHYLFFIYAMHEPLLHLCYQLGLTGSSSDLSHILLYICMPISVIAICIISGMAVRKLSKPVYSLLTGGRHNFYKTKK